LGAFETDLENVKLAWMWLCKYPDPVRFVALEDVVLLFDARARFNEGIRLFENALHVLKPKMTLPKNTNSNISDKVVAILSFNTAWLYIRIDKNVIALQHATRANQILQNSKASMLRVKALTVLGNASRDLGSFQIALEYFQQSLDIAKELKADHRVATALSNIGNCYLALGEYTNALNHFQTAQQIFIDLQDLTNANAIILSIVHLHLFCLEKDLSQIQDILLEAIRKADEHGQEMQILALKTYLMYTYIEGKRFEDAIYLRDTLLKTEAHQDDFYLMSSALLEAGRNHLKIAENELIRIARLNYAKNTPYLAHQAIFFYAKVALQQDDVVKAAPALHYLIGQKNIVKWIELKARTLAEQQPIQKYLFHSTPVKQLPWLI
jgi:tetratricopeptide (TPR) repeat protein